MSFKYLNEILDYGLYLRGVIITLYAIILFRTNSARLYGSHSPLDFIIYIILGAILGEAIVNNIPLISSMIVCTLIIAIHRFLAYLSFKSHRVGKYIKGEKLCIIKNGKYIQKNLRCCQITTNDVLQALRIQHGVEDLEIIKKAILERGGQISFILKK
ncbi:DUF421 domain-containing protein [Legionella hackeliae]|uniref:YetF C-terminal domain-containing protein n=1 Tax=Legionella hackeliae TaxID=449 RepID=A0A0A8UWP3_LEGHA|nr:YetF domain-containing protein [Legionella hackeliae]KTD13167.1 hypothetical protein Lhac_1036 [Legionella hackeliae]CEK11522.1 membrane protein of unknown function [Legionella hackeliae]STX48290.1 Protein of uncharacterised function (DUF421) [Legionella hackeliae]